MKNSIAPCRPNFLFFNLIPKVAANCNTRNGGRLILDFSHGANFQPWHAAFLLAVRCHWPGGCGHRCFNDDKKSSHWTLAGNGRRYPICGDESLFRKQRRHDLFGGCHSYLPSRRRELHRQKNFHRADVVVIGIRAGNPQSLSRRQKSFRALFAGRPVGSGAGNGNSWRHMDFSRRGNGVCAGGNDVLANPKSRCKNANARRAAKRHPPRCCRTDA
jgi:hypothetical protein